MTFDGRGVRTETFESAQELVLHYITQTTMSESWGTREHLEALEGTAALLARTIAGVRELLELDEDLAVASALLHKA